MNVQPSSQLAPQQNGPAAAAILSAGFGCFALAALAIAADRLPGVKSALILYRPTGPLSGVTTVALVLWLAAWLLLHFLWRRKNVAAARIGVISVVLLVFGLLLTFPPIADLF